MQTPDVQTARSFALRTPLSLLLASFTALRLLAASPEPGFAPLFNGKDLAGWIVKCKPADQGTAWWRVEDEAILAHSIGRTNHDYIWLVTDREYGDFTLRLQFQTFQDSPGNTGIQIRSRYDDEAGWLDGPQVDIHPPGPWRTGMVWDETRGNQRWLWPPVPKGKWVDESMAKPGRTFRFSGQGTGWNDLEITARGTHIKAVLNGLEIMSWDGAGVLDDELHRARRVGMKGHIALQIHTGDQLRARFRNLRLKED